MKKKPASPPKKNSAASRRSVKTPAFVDFLIPDINGVIRGKRENIARWPPPLGGYAWPASVFAMRWDGAVAQGSGFGPAGGDPDYPAVLEKNTLARCAWNDGAQGLLRLTTPEGAPFYADPREVLRGVLARLGADGIKAVMAVEFEFFLTRPSGKMLGEADNLYAADELEARAPFLNLCQRAAAAQNIPLEGAIAEYAPGQWEINLCHTEAQTAALHGALLRRLVCACARACGLRATFMAKPFGGRSGSGMHLHLNLTGRRGQNLFASAETLRRAAESAAAAAAESMAFFAPFENSYRRFMPGKYVPLRAGISANNRNAALRLPVATPKSARMEMRLPGADANPFLAAAVLIAAAHRGVVNTEGKNSDSKSKPPAALPKTLRAALDALAKSRLARDYLDARFLRLYLAVKEDEWRAERSRVPAEERRRYMECL